jgi:hypothetical protein
LNQIADIQRAKAIFQVAPAEASDEARLVIDQSLWGDGQFEGRFFRDSTTSFSELTKQWSWFTQRLFAREFDKICPLSDQEQIKTPRPPLPWLARRFPLGPVPSSLRMPLAGAGGAAARGNLARRFG